MKKVALLFVCFMLLTSAVYAVHVRDYTRSDGTYVQGYERSSPNGTVTDNYSYKGNANPYTGQTGSDYNRNSPSSEYYGTGGGSRSHNTIGGSGRSLNN